MSGFAAGFFRALGRPLLALPINQMRGRLFRHPFPPYIAVIG